MPYAYVLINCDLGSQESIINEIAHKEGVKKVERTEGVYDIIVSMESSSIEKMKEIITWQIRRLPSVRSTVTLIIK